MVGKGGKKRVGVGVGDGVKVGVNVGVAVGVSVDVAVGGVVGVGGAAITAKVAGMHVAIVILADIHPNPVGLPAKTMYHQLPSKFLPATGAVPP